MSSDSFSKLLSNDQIIQPSQIKNIILDLDETLINSIEESEKDDIEMAKKNGYKSFESDTGYVVFIRPGLDEFLDFLFKNYSVSVWSAGSRDYVLDIVNEIIISKNKCVDFIFFSYHCAFSQKEKGYIKSLDFLSEHFPVFGYDKNNTLMIDDNIQVKKGQTKNCFLIKPFYSTENSKDRGLHSLKEKMENKGF